MNLSRGARLGIDEIEGLLSPPGARQGEGAGLEPAGKLESPR